MRIIGVIPARGGSKGIPRKNLVNLCGKPLMYFTIKAALESKFLTEVHVSSEDEEILNVAKSFGANVIRRPNELAEDYVPTAKVINHALKVLSRNKSIDLVVALQPTSPLRDSYDIDSAIELFIKNFDKAKTLVSITEYDHPPQWALIVKDNFIEPMYGRDSLNLPRQKLAKAFRPNGAIFIAKPNVLLSEETFYTNATLAYIMPREKSVDIDTEFDLALAKLLLEKNGRC